MKKYGFLYFIIISTFFAGIGFTSCGNDFLTAASPSSKPYGSDSVTEASVNQNLASCYHILLRDNYASGYNQIYLMSDLCSDDIFKGGSDAGDQKNLTELATFTCTPADNLGGLWALYYRGIARCNETLANIDKLGGTGGKLPQYKAETLFLRAFFYTWLWKFWGNIPYTTALLTASTNFTAPQITADEVYANIYDDLKAAEATGGLQLTSPEIARTNLAAIYMLKAEIVMYQKDQSKYDEVADNMASIIASGKYGLLSDFAAIWLQENEFCKESIFESNMGSTGISSSDWGPSAGNPYSDGTNLPIFISPNGLVDPDGVFETGGWGFAPARPYLFSVIGDLTGYEGKQPFFETGDVRRTASVTYWPLSTYSPRWQDTGYFLRKYAARKGYAPEGNPSLSYCNNLRIYRFVETLLNYAELVGAKGVSAKQGITAQSCLDQVRSRAGLSSIPANQANIELERHREFIGEGRRYWDLIRWGEAAQTLTENFLIVSPNGSTVDWNRTWADNKKYLPIPLDEVNARLGTPYEIIQNPY